MKEQLTMQMRGKYRSVTSCLLMCCGVVRDAMTERSRRLDWLRDATRSPIKKIGCATLEKMEELCEVCATPNEMEELCESVWGRGCAILNAVMGMKFWRAFRGCRSEWEAWVGEWMG